MKILSIFDKIEGNMHKRVFAFLLVLLSSFLLFSGDVSAANKFDYEIKSEFEFVEDKSAEVRYIIDIINNVSTPAPSAITVPAVGAEIKNVEASYADGKDLEATYNPETQTIRLETRNATSGQGEKWSVSVNYDSKIGTNLGNTFFAQIAPMNFADIDVIKHTLTLSADLALGIAVERGPKSASSQIVAGKQVTKWVNDQGAYGSAVGYMFGDDGVAQIKLTQTLSNDSFWWKTMTVTLPPDTNQQQVFLESVEPQPSTIKLDVDGNILLEYLLWPKQTVDVEASARIVVKNFSYSLDSKQLINDIPAEISTRYTTNTDTWQAGKVEVNYTDDTPVIEIIESVYDVVANLDNEGETAYDQAKNKSNTLVGELRGIGIPARLVLGKSFNNSGLIQSESGSHAWVEAYSPGIGWISLDVFVEQYGPTFGLTDVQRVGLVLRGIQDDFPPEQLLTTTVGYIDDEPAPEPPEMIPALNATNYMIFPGIALQSVEVTMPAGVIVDGSAIQVGSATPRPLGSLAPLQTAASRTFVFAGSAFASENVIYGILDGDFITEPLAQTTTSTNYIPMLVIFLGGGLIVLIVMWLRRRSRNKKTKVSTSKHSITYATENDGGEIEKDELIPTPKTTQQGTDSETSTKDSATIQSDNNKKKSKFSFRKNKRKPTEIR